jgi:hypothetical protein
MTTKDAFTKTVARAKEIPLRDIERVIGPNLHSIGVTNHLSMQRDPRRKEGKHADLWTLAFFTYPLLENGNAGPRITGVSGLSFTTEKAISFLTSIKNEADLKTAGLRFASTNEKLIAAPLNFNHITSLRTVLEKMAQGESLNRMAVPTPTPPAAPRR